MMKIFWTLAVLSVLFFASVAKAEAGCMAPEEVLEIIALKQEVNAFKGMAGDAGVAAVFVNPETQTWTVVSFFSNGEACIVSAGVGFGLMNPEDMEKPVDPRAKDA